MANHFYREPVDQHLRIGPRQVGKTTLSQQLLNEFPGGQYLNFDVAAHRAVIQAQSWRMSAPLLVFDEIHKMRDWKSWLKGVYDGRAAGHPLISARSPGLGYPLRLTH